MKRLNLFFCAHHFFALITLFCLIILIACSSHSAPAQTNVTNEENSVSQENHLFSLTWTLQRTYDGYDIRYQIENRSTENIWLLDESYVPTVNGYQPEPRRIIVMQDQNPNMIRLIRAHVRPPIGQGVAREYTPVARLFSARATLTGAAHVDLPIRPWHPYYTVFPFSQVPTHAVFEIGILQGNPPDQIAAWETNIISTADQSVLKVPTLAYVVQNQKIVRGQTQRIP